MQSTITARGQTVIPAAIRRRFQLSPGDRLEWIVENDMLQVIPARKDPIAAFQGQGKGRSIDRPLAERNGGDTRE